MRVRFQADADLDGRILRGVRRTAPEIDFRTAAEARFHGLRDPEVLRIAADSGRILVSQDRTMPAHFRRHVNAGRSPGVVLLREATPIAVTIAELVFDLELDRSISVDSTLGSPHGVKSTKQPISGA